jgi:hypothetical protein
MENMSPDFKPPVAGLFELANTPLDPPAFRQACERFSGFDPGSSSDDLWFFSLEGRAWPVGEEPPSLWVLLKTERVRRKKSSGRPEFRPIAVAHAVLEFYWWEQYLEEEHESRASWEAERAEFDRIYAEALAATVEVLGPPWVHGTDPDEKRLRHAVWRCKTALLILQQSDIDPARGLNVSYRVQPWSGVDPRPTSPFRDWIASLYPSS